MRKRYEELLALTVESEGWLESRPGSDLWVDGLNVFLNVEPDEFEAGFARFLSDYPCEMDLLIETLEALQRYCLDAAKEGEFELYQALSVGMTYLTLHPEVNGEFFNIPVQVTNHSLALLLSPTYRAVWVHSYNAGLELVIDLKADRPTIFRPEHGRIYQMGRWHQAGEVIRFPFVHYFHEMSHVLLFSDLYARVIGTPDEDRSAFVNMEAAITCLENVVLGELMAVQEDLNLIDDGFGTVAVFQEAADFRMSVFRGDVEGVTPQSLALYLKRNIQFGEDDFLIPENRIKQAILSAHQLSDREVELIAPHYADLINNQHGHAGWGKEACERNRLPAFREVAELLPVETFALAKLEESLHSDSWSTSSQLFSCEKLPEPNRELREQNKRRWRFRELLFRIAETRGFLQQGLPSQNCSAQTELLEIAEEIADVLNNNRWMEPALYENMLRDVKHCLSDEAVGDMMIRERVVAIFEQPFSYLLEPR
ncbi:hypothetical protein [Tumebacillus lipolyticus]|uniref:Uncharacterized protein n=1 Tax=Tumebacillus lipolyticus TaxID=1280370 RepID=A0ABW5A0Z5_9BACL